MGITTGHLETGTYGREQVDFPPLDHGPLDLRAWFSFPPVEGPARPMDLEVGSGKGTFLVQQAALTPEVDYLGIEYARAYYRHAADRARRHGLANVRMLHAEAGMFLRNFVADASFRQVHIYFPDPWPKKRHHKRRFVQESTLRELYRVLAARSDADPRAGCIRLATDHAEYFEWMTEHAGKVDDLYERLPFDPPDSAGAGELVGTNFERKYRLEGRTFNGMVLRKR